MLINIGACIRSGSVCLDVINQTWSPMYEMLNIFESFLPQLLTYPNAADPLNGEAAALYMRDEKAYAGKVKGMAHFLPRPVGCSCGGNNVLTHRYQRRIRFEIREPRRG